LPSTQIESPEISRNHNTAGPDITKVCMEKENFDLVVSDILLIKN